MLASQARGDRGSDRGRPHAVASRRPLVGVPAAALAGLGNATFSARRVALCWIAMMALATPTDTDLGDLLARASVGPLWFDKGRPGGIRSGVEVGALWQGMAAST